jgi:hypothetical protein
MSKVIRCYAEGRPGAWEAICLDLDIAVQGASFDEVFNTMNAAIKDYVESLEDLPETDRARLLNRKAPLRLRLKFLWLVLRSTFSNRSGDGSTRAEFTVPLGAAAA